MACIPGVSIERSGKGQAFIQLINGWNTNTDFFVYPIDAFTYSERHFDIRIGSSSFSSHRIRLDIEQNDRAIHGDIAIGQSTSLRTSFFSPGIMGWYAFVPFMECYHGIVSLNHHLSGHLVIDDRRIDFNGGRGYIEKDWGTSFPSSWVWLQSNHFGSDNASFMLSIARIPWITGSFIGFLCVLHVNDVEYRFATYTGSTVERLHIEDRSVHVQIADNLYHLDILASQGTPAGLKAPVNGGMDRIIAESVSSEVEVRLETKTGEGVFNDTGIHGGMEIAGNINELFET